jgi:DNA-binding NtrC family response regulator
MLDVLVADDDENVLDSVSRALMDGGHQVTEAVDGAQAAELVAAHAFDLAICDVQMPKLNGLALLRRIRRAAPGTAVVMMTAYGQIPDVVDSLRDGATDFVTKPFDPQEFVRDVVAPIALQRALKRKLDEARARLVPRAAGVGLVAISPAMRKVVGRIGALANSDVPVILSGDRGTGKEVVARTIHAQGSRRDGPFVLVDGVALADRLLADDPRGPEDPVQAERDAWFQDALGGTLVLDGVEKLPLVAQAHLTRILGATDAVARRSPGGQPLGARLITITRERLADRVVSSKLLESLHYRLSGVHLRVPPLRERGDDLLPLVTDLLRELVPETQPTPRISGDAWEELSSYGYPGNVRELQWILQHALAKADGGRIEARHLPAEIASPR